MRNIKMKIKAGLAWAKAAVSKWLLFVLLGLVYFCVVTPYALVRRWVLRRSLTRSRSSWVVVSESTDQPGLFDRSV